MHDSDVRRLVALARQRALSHVAQPPAHDLLRIDVDDEQRLLEAGRPCEHVPLVVDHAGVPVEDELVLGADRIAERDEAGVVSRAGDEHLLALSFLSDVVRRSGDVRDELGACERQVRRRRARLPHVLADGRSDQRLPHLEQDQVASRGEIAVLVEDAVVREEPLADDRLHLAAGADCAGVVEVAVEVRRADERRDSAARAGDLLERALGGADEARAEEEVLGGIAGDDQLGEEDDVHALLLRLVEALQDPSGVPLQVADDGVHLGEGDPHSLRLTVENYHRS